MKRHGNWMRIAVLIAVALGLGLGGCQQMRPPNVEREMSNAMIVLAPASSGAFPELACDVVLRHPLDKPAFKVIPQEGASDKVRVLSSVSWHEQAQQPLLAAVVLANDHYLKVDQEGGPVKGATAHLCKELAASASTEVAIFSHQLAKSKRQPMECLMKWGPPVGRVGPALNDLEPANSAPLLNIVYKGLEALQERLAASKSPKPPAVLVVLASDWRGEDTVRFDDVVALAREAGVSIYGLEVMADAWFADPAQSPLGMLKSLADATNGDVRSVLTRNVVEVNAAAGDLAAAIVAKEMGRRFHIKWKDERAELPGLRGYDLVAADDHQQVKGLLNAEIPNRTLDEYRSRIKEGAIQKAKADLFASIQAAESGIAADLGASAKKLMGMERSDLWDHSIENAWDAATRKLAEAQMRKGDLAAAGETLERRRFFLKLLGRGEFAELLRYAIRDALAKKNFESALKSAAKLCDTASVPTAEDQLWPAVIYTAWAKSCPEDADGLQQAIVLYGKARDAVKDYKEAVEGETAARSAMAKLIVSQAERVKRDDEKGIKQAEDLYKKALEYDPKCQLAVTGRARLTLDLARVRLKQLQYDEAIALVGKDPSPEAQAIVVEALCGQIDGVLRQAGELKGKAGADVLLQAKGQLHRAVEVAKKAKLADVQPRLVAQQEAIDKAMTRLADMDVEARRILVGTAIGQKTTPESILIRIKDALDRNDHAQVCAGFEELHRSAPSTVSAQDMAQWAVSEGTCGDISKAVCLMRKCGETEPVLFDTKVAREFVQAVHTEGLSTEMKITAAGIAAMPEAEALRLASNLFLRSRADLLCAVLYGPNGKVEKCSQASVLSQELMAKAQIFLGTMKPEEGILQVKRHADDGGVCYVMGMYIGKRFLVVFPSSRFATFDQEKAIADVQNAKLAFPQRSLAWEKMTVPVREFQGRSLAETLATVVAARKGVSGGEMQGLTEPLTRYGPFAYLVIQPQGGQGQAFVLGSRIVEAGNIPADQSLATVIAGTIRFRRIGAVSVREQIIALERTQKNQASMLRLGIVISGPTEILSIQEGRK